MKRLIVVLVIATAVVVGCTSEAGNTITASDTCHDAVSNLLKSPGSASWQNSENESISGDAATGYTVVGHVDSENSFGASLRSWFSCKVTVDGDEYSAKVTAFDDGGDVDS